MRKHRSATYPFAKTVRGLKAPATGIRSLRDEEHSTEAFGAKGNELRLPEVSVRKSTVFSLIAPRRAVGAAMKSFFLALFLCVVAMRAGNAKPIPPEMVGDWRYLDGMIEIRVDGFAFVGSSIGAACFATYESENVLKLDPRPRPGEIGKGTPKLPEFIVSYDPKTLTMTLSLEGEPTKKLGPYKRLTPTVYPDFEKYPLSSLPAHWNG